MKGVSCQSWGEVCERGVGAFFVDRSDPTTPSVVMILPGDECPIRIPVLPAQNGWTLTGPDDAPTLSPSILTSGLRPWHGWLRGGVFPAC